MSDDEDRKGDGFERTEHQPIAGDSLVIVRKCLYVGDADVIRIELEEAGIDVWLADINMVQAEWILGNAMGGIKVQVRSRDEAEALRVIAEFDRMRQERRDQRENSTVAGIEEDACLACGGPIGEAVSTCTACGWSYADEDPLEDAEEDSVW